MLFLVLLSHLGFSYSPSTVEAMFNAQDLDSFVQIREKIQEVQKLKQGCHWEIANKEFPFHCLAEMELKMSSPLNLEEVRIFQKKVNRVCTQSVQQVQNLGRLEESLESQFISHSCREAIQNRILDLKYIAKKILGLNIEKFQRSWNVYKQKNQYMKSINSWAKV